MLLAAVCVSAQLLGAAFGSAIGGSNIFALPLGIGLGWMCARGERMWPGLLVGSFVGELVAQATDPSIADSNWSGIALAAMSLSVSGVLAALASVMLARRLLTWPLTLLRPREIVLFVVLVIPSGALLATVLDAAGQQWIAASTSNWYWEDRVSECMSMVLGSLVCVPMVLVCFGQPREVWRRRRMMALVLPVLALGVMWGAVEVSNRLGKVEAAEFRAKAVKILAGLELDFAGHLLLAEELTAFFASSTLVERDEFESFSRPLLVRIPSVQAVSWEPCIEGSARVSFEDAAVAEGIAGFRFTELSATKQRMAVTMRADYFPVWFIVPLLGNQSAIGYDLGSEPTRRAAIDAARATGKLTATAPIRLVQANNNLGVLLFAPIFSKETKAFAGCVSVVTNATAVGGRTNELFAAQQMHFTIIDQEAPSADALLFTSSAAVVAPADRARHLRLTHDIEFGGRRWRADVSTTDAYAATTQPWMFFVRHALFAVLLACVVATHLFTSGREMLVEAVVNERSTMLRESAQRFRQLVDAAPTALIAVSQSGVIVMANARTLSLLGYTLDQLLGQSPDMLLAPSEGAPAASSISLLDLREYNDSRSREVVCHSAMGARVWLEVRHSSVVSDEHHLLVLALLEVSRSASVEATSGHLQS
ncbi:MAG: PAS domain S-box protein [Planctomycetota bacterium]|nr:MAG: PAS domain S-box protein [Planctomycetota bacterium]